MHMLKPSHFIYFARRFAAGAAIVFCFSFPSFAFCILIQTLLVAFFVFCRCGALLAHTLVFLGENSLNFGGNRPVIPISFDFLFLLFLFVVFILYLQNTMILLMLCTVSFCKEARW